MLKTLKYKHKIPLLFLKCGHSSKIQESVTENLDAINFDAIPGPKCYPVIGSLYKYWPFLGDYNTEAIDKVALLNWRRYGELVKEVSGVRLLHVYDPDLIEIVFRQKERYPARRSHTAMLHYRLSKPQVYNTGGLLSTNGADWWRLRSTFQKNFSSPQNAKRYIEQTDYILRRFVRFIEDIKISHHHDFLPYLNRLYLEVIGKIAFNEDFESFSSNEQDPKSRSSRIIDAAFGSNSGIMKLDNGIMWRLFSTPLYKKLTTSQEYLEKVSMDILLQRMSFYENEKDDNDKSLLESFLHLPNTDMKDLIGVMVDILMAAIDTTSYTTSFALYHLARNQECQEKFFNEISSLLPRKETELFADVLSKAVYVKSCVKESLRLNPVAIGVGRVSQNDITLKGYMIPKGTVIVTQNMIASRLPQYIKDPLSFKPERWIRGSEQYENIHPFLSLPFGFGPRACIARRLAEQNICITMIRLIREYKIEWMGGELGIKTFLINKPDQPISLTFTPRAM